MTSEVWRRIREAQRENLSKPVLVYKWRYEPYDGGEWYILEHRTVKALPSESIKLEAGEWVV